MLKCLLEKEKKSTAWREGRGIIVTFLNVIKKKERNFYADNKISLNQWSTWVYTASDTRFTVCNIIKCPES